MYNIGANAQTTARVGLLRESDPSQATRPKGPYTDNSQCINDFRKRFAVTSYSPVSD